jgi:hypothetical protein
MPKTPPHNTLKKVKVKGQRSPAHFLHEPAHQLMVQIDQSWHGHCRENIPIEDQSTVTDIPNTLTGSEAQRVSVARLYVPDISSVQSCPYPNQGNEERDGSTSCDRHRRWSGLFFSYAHGLTGTRPVTKLLDRDTLKCFELLVSR